MSTSEEHPSAPPDEPLRGAFDLLRMDGRVTRGQYLAIGAVLALFKYALDLAVSRAFHQPWNPLMYLSPRVSPFLRDDAPRTYLFALGALTLPFAWVGVSLTVRRVRDAGLSSFWAGLFFLPFFRYAFFLALASIPSARAPRPGSPDRGPFRERSGPPLPEPPPPRLLVTLIPRGTGAAYLLAICASLLFALAAYVIASQLHSGYGGVFFGGLPFAIGLFVAFTTSFHTDLSRRAAIGNGLLVHGVLFLLLLALAWEGVACILMAAPLVLAMSALGGAVGWGLTRTRRGDLIVTMLLLAAPVLLGVDLARGHEPEASSVVSELRIGAPIETVWRNVVAFPPIDETPAAIFAMVAMPIQARIDGEGPGAIRHCIFTNGEFEEPILTWRAPEELTFGVHSAPPGIYDYIDVTRGQFLLRDNGDGTTTLRGETWFSMKVHPTGYFNAWSRYLLHQVHLRVLHHIQRISEHPEAMVTAAAAVPTWIATSQATCTCTRAGAATTP